MGSIFRKDRTLAETEQSENLRHLDGDVLITWALIFSGSWKGPQQILPKSLETDSSSLLNPQSSKYRAVRRNCCDSEEEQHGERLRWWCCYGQIDTIREDLSIPFLSLVREEEWNIWVLTEENKLGSNIYRPRKELCSPPPSCHCSLSITWLDLDHSEF